MPIGIDSNAKGTILCHRQREWTHTKRKLDTVVDLGCPARSRRTINYSSKYFRPPRSFAVSVVRPSIELNSFGHRPDRSAAALSSSSSAFRVVLVGPHCCHCRDFPITGAPEAAAAATVTPKKRKHDTVCSHHSAGRNSLALGWRGVAPRTVIVVVCRA